MMMALLPQDSSHIVERYRARIPVQVGALAKELGVLVLRSTLHPGISGLIEPSDEAPSGYIIRVNRHEKRERQRFTIAHEIGHYCLHKQNIGKGIIDTILYRSRLSSALEVEANKFAAELLMPLETVHRMRQDLQNLSPSALVAELAARFEVSVDAMEIRLGMR